jgi:hypothetical protein
MRITFLFRLEGRPFFSLLFQYLLEPFRQGDKKLIRGALVQAWRRQKEYNDSRVTLKQERFRRRTVTETRILSARDDLFHKQTDYLAIEEPLEIHGEATRAENGRGSWNETTVIVRWLGQLRA